MASSPEVGGARIERRSFDPRAHHHGHDMATTPNPKTRNTNNHPRNPSPSTRQPDPPARQPAPPARPPAQLRPPPRQPTRNRPPSRLPPQTPAGSATEHRSRPTAKPPAARPPAPTPSRPSPLGRLPAKPPPPPIRARSTRLADRGSAQIYLCVCVCVLRFLQHNRKGAHEPHWATPWGTLVRWPSSAGRYTAKKA